MKFKKVKNLVPDQPSQTPDYFCTWQTQLFATSDGKTVAQRNVMGEKSLFDKEKPYGWAYFFEEARQDLIFLMDSGWDVDVDKVLELRGSHFLNKGKFPSFAGDETSHTQALKALGDKISELGWKGLGLWVASEENVPLLADRSIEEYWVERMQMSKDAGIKYWKVDNGPKRRDPEFRKWLAEKGKEQNCDFMIENALVRDSVSYSDVYRLYDVHALVAIPMTLEKIYGLRDAPSPDKRFPCLVTTDDEMYISAALGMAFEVLRHPYAGDFPDGKKDCSYPAIGRNIKTKIAEITRAARWHRLAPAFAFDSAKTIFSEEFLCDEWHFENVLDEIEDWWLKDPIIKNYIQDNVLTKGAPAMISREIEPPQVSADKNGNKPYVVASKNPNGAVSIATLGRTLGREYFIPKCDISLCGGDSTCFGVFGDYRNLTIKTDLDLGSVTVLMQDLADDVSYDVTEAVEISEGKIVIPGSLISEIGALAQPEGDTSDVGVVIKLENV